MKSISLKPAGTAQNFRILAANVRRTFVSKNLAIAAISAGGCWLSTLAGCDTLAAAAAFAALIAIRPYAIPEEGGES